MTHRGVLFLDELAEFAPSVLDSLRQPLEEGTVHVARARESLDLPARFLLVAAMNPCPCGGCVPGACECAEAVRRRYLARVSGPLLDRFDLRVRVERPAVDDLIATEPGEPSAAVAERVARARRRALERQGSPNAELGAAALDRVAALDTPARSLLAVEMEAGRLSGRGFHRVRRVARTLADLAGDAEVGEGHVSLALRLRSGFTGRSPAGLAA